MPSSLRQTIPVDVYDLTKLIGQVSECNEAVAVLNLKIDRIDMGLKDLSRRIQILEAQRKR